ncbi:MAG: hypothetical protein VX320_01930, partial [Candidatus Thermoplasmatota archaeon]|nr:hypothetical protein [Candidatus Thermoplasmatota archaeon]
MQPTDAPPVPAEGLPEGWTMEQWVAYGAVWLVQEQQKAASQVIPETTAPVVEPEYVAPTEPPVPEPVSTTPPPISEPSHPTFSLGARPSVKPGEERPDYQFHQGPISAPGLGVPTPMYNYDYGDMNQNRRKLVIGGSVIAVLLVTTLILALLPPGAFVLMDDFRDRDSDGLSDAQELALGTNPQQADTDQDGLGDYEDDCPSGLVGWQTSAMTDHDRDGCKDDSLEDLDDDNDGIPDVEDNCPLGIQFWSNSGNDWDGDGCRDSEEDGDDDNDGWSDQNELDCDSNPLSALTVPNYLYNDWICDRNDSDVDGDGINNDGDVYPMDRTQWADSDGDGYGDNSQGNNGDAFPYEASQWADSDGDGYGDNQEGVSPDVFPNDGTEWVDFDGDGVGDNADTDDDNDGVLDIYDANDYADAGILISLTSLTLFETMDVWDS